MVVKGQMTTIVEPVEVKFKYSKQVQVLYQAEGEERPPTWARTSHSQHISLIVSSKGAIWGDDSEDLRFIVLHGELR